MLQRSLIFILLTSCLVSISSCKHEPYNPPHQPQGNFPGDVANIMIKKCATTGCHDAAGAVNAARLRLDTWDELFKGSSHGAVVVPYSTRYSTLLYYINTNTANGIVAVPTMPYNMPPLSQEEYDILKNWIANGAPDANGNIAFAANADTRQKIYITQQGCDDLVAVVDAASNVVMRYIPVGDAGGNRDNPHFVRVSNDGKYAYVCFTSGTMIQKIDAATDAVVGSVEIGSGSWNVINVSPDGTRLLVSDMSGRRVKLINTSGSMSVMDTYDNIFSNPHGIAATPNFDTFYITSQYGRTIYKFSPFEPPVFEEIDISSSALNLDPHEIVMSPDYSRYFVTCQGTDEVRVVDARTDTVIAAIPVGKMPLEMAISPSRNLLFVTCQEDPYNPRSLARGSVYVIDMATLQPYGLPLYGDFFQPHGISVDEQNKRLYVTSRNISLDGPAPHHSATCEGRNGWYSIYDLNTLQPLNNIRYEITPDPYGSDVRFK